MSSPEITPDSSLQTDLISIGVLTQAFGRDGAMKLRSSGDVAHLTSIKKVWCEALGWLTVRKTDIHNEVLLLKFADVVRREDTDHLRGLELFVPKSAVRLPKGSYFYHDLIGLPVVAPDGSSLGVLKSIMDAGTADILVVSYVGKDVLVPLQAPYVRILGDTIEIEPISGLFE